MNKRLSFALIIALGFLLLVFYQNMGVLSQNDTKELVFPGYFSDVYKKELLDSTQTQEEKANKYLYNSPLYKQLSNPLFSNYEQKSNCNIDESVCLNNDESLVDDNTKPPLSFSLDPLKTLARIKVNNEWLGQIYYPTSSGPRYEIKRAMSQSSELNLQYDSGSNQGKISVEIKW